MEFAESKNNKYKFGSLFLNVLLFLNITSARKSDPRPSSDFYSQNKRSEELLKSFDNSVKSLDTDKFTDSFVKKTLQFHRENIFKSRSISDFLDKLMHKKIILIVDNSGSMSLTIQERSHLRDYKLLGENDVITRQKEALFNILGALQIFYSIPGCNPDVYLLNPVLRETKIQNIFNSYELLQTTINLLTAFPKGFTPTVDIFENVFEDINKNGISNAHILFFTDGQPFDLKENTKNTCEEFYNLIHKKLVENPQLSMNIIVCTDVKSEVAYLDELDKELTNLDVCDDFHTEFEQMKINNKDNEGLEKTHSGYMYKVVVGCLDSVVDRLDEKND